MFCRLAVPWVDTEFWFSLSLWTWGVGQQDPALFWTWPILAASRSGEPAGDFAYTYGTGDDSHILLFDSAPPEVDGDITVDK